MAWRLAKSIKTLLDQVNAENPHRRKDSDGGIGDAAHASRSSDHNPYIVVKGQGVVRAFDFTHAPETGFDEHADGLFESSGVSVQLGKMTAGRSIDQKRIDRGEHSLNTFTTNICRW